VGVNSADPDLNGKALDWRIPAPLAGSGAFAPAATGLKIPLTADFFHFVSLFWAAGSPWGQDGADNTNRFGQWSVNHRKGDRNPWANPASTVANS
jgi:hypothetical protein